MLTYREQSLGEACCKPYKVKTREGIGLLISEGPLKYNFREEISDDRYWPPNSDHGLVGRG